MTRNVDDTKLENLNGGTMDSSGVRDDDPHIPPPFTPPPNLIDVQNEAEGGENVHFGR